MKKLVFSLTIMIASIYGIQAQKMDVGTNFLSLGAGPSSSYNGYQAIGMPAIRLSFDHGLKEIGPGVLTLGGTFGFFNEHYN